MNRILKSTLLACILLALSACGGGAGGTGFTPGYKVSGTLTGIAGRDVVLQNNGGNNLTVTGNGATAVNFTFSTWLSDAAAYSVTVLNSPGQTCVVTGGTSGTGSGTIAAADVTSIVVTCTPINYSVGVTITGLTGSVTLQNNLTPIGAISANGTYATAFPGQDSGTTYDITVLTQPAGQTCSVSNSSGTVVDANIVATVTCTAPCANCSVGGTITGLQAGQTVALQVSINGGGATAVPSSPFSANGSFTAATGLVSNDTYDVSIATQPANQPCSVTYGTGTIKAAGVTNVNVFCGYTPRGGFAPAASMGTTTRQNHTATLLGNGKVLVVGGYTSAGSATNTATLYDPATNTWTTTGSLSAARYSHTATLLNTGRVLVVGGYNGSSVLSSAEIYDPATGNWALAADLSTVLLPGRYLHTATLLNDGTGRVLVAGGYNLFALNTSAVYNPTNNTWAVPTGTFTGRYAHTATSLTDTTNRVLVVGGTDGANPLGVVEYFDPASNSWSADATLIGTRYLHTATLLSDGKVMVSGGVSGGVTIGSAEIYTPTGALTQGSWASAGTLNNVRYSHTATLLTSNKVLVMGGCNVPNTCSSTAVLASAEIYDPGTNAWTAAGTLADQRYQHAAVMLGSGKVLVSGGSSGTSQLATAELFDPAMIGWSATGSIATTRYRHTTTRLDGPGGGKVLVAGGFSGPAGSGSETSISELYDALGGTAISTGSLNTARYDHTATLLADGRVLVAGGYAGTATLASSEIYDPATGNWTATTGTLNQKRSQHTATLLNDGTGRVLVAGGWDGVNAAALTSAELYDPGTQTWSTVDSLNAGRYQHTATLLPDGRVLVAGGVSSGTTTLTSAEVYDPNNPSGSGVVSWTNVGAMSSAHRQHTATLLPNGTVLVAGGMSGASKVNTATIFNPVANTWAATGALIGSRTWHTATLLPDGKVLVTGGLNTTALATAELYSAGTWSQADDLLSARYQHAATLLQNGQLLVTGGYSGTTSLGAAELGW